MAEGGDLYYWETFDEAKRRVRKEKYFQYDKNDVFESEVTYEGELGLITAYENCPKNPGHRDFIPIYDFKLQNLPADCRYQDVFDTVKALAYITVRVDSNYISFNRPPFIGQGEKKVPYPHYDERGALVRRVGTGRIRYVTEQQDGPCICQPCQRSGQPNTTWFKVGVVTATHLVYDVEEARQTRCTVGYDSDASAVETIDGVGISAHGKTVEGDRFNLCCVTHDPDLAKKLRDHAALFKSLCQKVSQKFKSIGRVSGLVVLVSHPHGSPKKVSLGRWTKNNVTSSGYTRYLYSASTCKGTSGAAVYIPDRLTFGWCTHIHSIGLTSGCECKSGGGYA